MRTNAGGFVWYLGSEIACSAYISDTCAAAKGTAACLSELWISLGLEDFDAFDIPANGSLTHAAALVIVDGHPVEPAAAGGPSSSSLLPPPALNNRSGAPARSLPTLSPTTPPPTLNVGNESSNNNSGSVSSINGGSSSSNSSSNNSSSNSSDSGTSILVIALPVALIGVLLCVRGVGRGIWFFKTVFASAIYDAMYAEVQ